MAKLTLGISACVAGQKVRFDAGNKPSKYCMDQLSQYADFVPICPEVAIGLPVPRKTLRQIEYGELIKVSHPDGSSDVTEALTEYGKSIGQSHQNLDGYIFCAKSPSCGVEKVKVYYDHQKGCRHDGTGLFAKEIMAAQPNLPVEENGRLNDPLLRENFVLRIFTFNLWRSLSQKETFAMKDIIAFHSQHKYLIMSHSVQAYRELGKLIGENGLPFETLSTLYISQLMIALKKPATRRMHSNTLAHLQGYFKRCLSSKQKVSLAENIDQYRQGLIPLMAPISLLKHYLSLYPNAYLEQQRYFSPYPEELRLRYAM